MCENNKDKRQGRKAGGREGGGGLSGTLLDVIILHFQRQNRDKSLLTRLKGTETTRLSFVMCYALV